MKKVTVVGAGKYGSMTALRVAEYNLASEVVMTDIVEGLPQGLALDINQSRFVEKFDTKVSGLVIIKKQLIGCGCYYCRFASKTGHVTYGLIRSKCWNCY